MSRLVVFQKRYEPIKISCDFLSSIACAISDLRDDVRGAIDLRASFAVGACQMKDVHIIIQVEE